MMMSIYNNSLTTIPDSHPVCCQCFVLVSLWVLTTPAGTMSPLNFCTGQTVHAAAHRNILRIVFEISCRSDDLATVFAFASPGNQAVTGPLRRFTAMLASPTYRPLVGYSSSEQQYAHMRSAESYTTVVAIKSSNTGDTIQKILATQ